jgi:hypothetical protein
VAHGILLKGRGTVEEVVDILYPNYIKHHNQYPDMFPYISKPDILAQISRLVEIQRQHHAG